MPSDLSMNEAQNVWQNQPTETFSVSLDTLRRKAVLLNRKARLAVLRSTVVALVLFLCFGWGFLSFPERGHTVGLDGFGAWCMRLGFAVLSLWGLYSGYRSYQALWPNAAVSDAELATTLQAYKQQLVTRRDYVRDIWVRSGLNVCFLGMAMVVVPVMMRDVGSPLALLAKLGPLLALLVFWLAIFIPQRRRRQRKLQDEIDHLLALEKECRS